MQTIEYRFIDKSDWPDGPWKDEPDKVQWPDPETGLPCLARRNHAMGFWCGYVGVADGHPWFGQKYDAHDVEVHCGLTFSELCVEGDKEHGICHLPDAGEPDHVWWFGFDCGHLYDLSPRTLKFVVPNPEDVYRTLDYVRAECAGLARQLAAAGGGKHVDS